MADDDGNDGNGDNGDARFTQEDVDRIVADRLKRAKLDVEEIRELRERAEQVPRLEARVQTLERERDTSRQDTERERERANTATLRSEVMSAASRAGAVDPEDVFRLLPDGAIKLEEGKAVGVEEAVKALSERKGHLFSTAKSRPSGGDGGPRDDGGGSPGRQVDMSRNMRRMAGYQR